MKIVYTRGNRTETLASLTTLRKILNRFVARRVFYEVSSRQARGQEFFSAKKLFVVGLIEVSNVEHLRILIFDANNSAHSIEILNPANDAHLRRDSRTRFRRLVRERQRRQRRDALLFARRRRSERCDPRTHGARKITLTATLPVPRSDHDDRDRPEAAKAESRFLRAPFEALRSP